MYHLSTRLLHIQCFAKIAGLQRWMLDPATDLDTNEPGPDYDKRSPPAM